ncbi:hypothetical protein V865_001557 [Kwoniella europaea PYCC6329]|uniref:Uncharacterized protein n=1 Tax=Kwoniella europaea PYCC6329 TaxID=1423913 RepID=A0AAX4KDE9_9TREE
MSSEETPSATLLPDPIFARQGYIAETADLSLAISIIVDPTNSVNESRTASGRVTGIRQPGTEPVDEDLTGFKSVTKDVQSSNAAETQVESNAADLIPSSLRGPIDCQNTESTYENIVPRNYYYPK